MIIERGTSLPVATYKRYQQGYGNVCRGTVSRVLRRLLFIYIVYRVVNYIYGTVSHQTFGARLRCPPPRPVGGKKFQTFSGGHNCQNAKPLGPNVWCETAFCIISVFFIIHCGHTVFDGSTGQANNNTLYELGNALLLACPIEPCVQSNRQIL